MTRLRAWLTLGLSVVAVVTPHAAAEDRVLGACTVRERKDMMTDKQTCTAWHTSTDGVWLTPDALVIAPRGGVGLFRSRVGDDPVRDRLPTPRERATGSVQIDGKNLYVGRRMNPESYCRSVAHR